MRSLFFIFLGAVPLAVLTILAFGNILTVRGWRPDMNATHFSAQIAVASQTRDDFRRLGHAPEELAENNLLGSPLPASMQRMGDSVPLWGSTPRMLHVWSEIVGSSKSFFMSHRDWESQEVERLEEIKKQIRSFRSVLNAEKEYQGKALKLLTMMDKDVDSAILRVQKTKEAQSYLLDARNALDSEDWQTCATLCRKLQQEYENYTSADVKTDVLRMSSRCAFHLGESSVSLSLDSASADNNQRDELRAFLDQFDSPDQLSDSERQKYEAWKARLEQMDGSAVSDESSVGEIADVDSQDALDSQTRAILKPFFESANSFPVRVRLASRILQENDTPAVRQALKGEIMKLIRQGIPEKSSAELPSAQGKLVERYNKGRDHLLQHASDREVWAKFIAFCNNLDEKQKSDAAPVSFAAQSRAAQMISDPDLWPKVVEIIK